MQTEIIVLSAENHLIFTPMLPEVVGGPFLLFFVEREDCHVTGWFLDNFAADNGAVLAVHQLGGSRDFGTGESYGFGWSFRLHHSSFPLVHRLAGASADSFRNRQATAAASNGRMIFGITK